MRPLLPLIAAFGLILALASTDALGTRRAESSGGTVFVVAGGGWGHGVGLSQWGAHGQALAGRDYRAILAHYFRNTTIGVLSGKRTVRVLLAAAAPEAAITSSAPFRARDSAGTEVELAAGRLVVGPGLRVPVDGRPTRLEGPVTLIPANGVPLSLGDAPYRGTLELAAEGARLRVVNVVPLERYLEGVVAREMPREWPLEALKAQAVAARSYAIANLLQGKPFDLYPDWRSQVYGGVAAEAPAATRAVRETARQVVLHDGKVATTFFFSSSGGRTASGTDVFGLELPYLVSVPDPWDADSPNHVWEPRVLDGRALARTLGLAAPVTDVVSDVTPSGRPRAVAVTTKAGGKATLTGTELRARLGLLSPFFRVVVLKLGFGQARLGAAARPGIVLEGAVRAVDRALIEKRTDDGSWVPAVRPRVRPDGTFTVVVRPRTATRYRITGDGLAGPELVVRPRAVAG